MAGVPILFRDEHLIVVDKPPGTLVVDAPGRRCATLVDLVTRQLGRRVYAVHRLDEDTTGCLLLALDEATRGRLDTAFREHAVERDYLALLSAVPSPEAGRIEANLEEGADGIVRVVARGGRIAVTHYQTLARRGRGCLVRCRLETGRRNQIRVHFAALGCPLAGDRKYGYRPRSGESFPRPMLHSWKLRLIHPCGGGPIAVVCDPTDAALAPPEVSPE